MKSKSRICREYKITPKQLEKAIWDCLRSFLSEEELEEFIFNQYHSKEMKLNRKEQIYVVTPKR